MNTGDQVNYTVSAQDVTTLAQTSPRGASSGVRIGSLPRQGEQSRATVVRVNPGGTVNLNVVMDANIGHWVKNVTEGAGEGQWSALV